MQVSDSPSTLETEPSKTFVKTKARIKQVKVQQPSREKQQPVFNDPLYEYLDNEEVYNKEEHNFGPWVELERKSSHKYRQRKIMNSLPNLTPQRLTTHYRQLYERPEPSALPHIQHFTGKLSSLRELRSISLELQAQKQEDKRYRKQKSNKHLFFLKGHPSYPSPSLLPYDFFLMSQNSQNKRSNFNYNHCLREEQQSRLLSLKLRSKADGPYLQLQKCKNPEALTNLNHKNLLKELKEHRMNKLK